jgi:hypothetical protein
MEFTNIILSTVTEEHSLCYEIYMSSYQLQLGLSLAHALPKDGIFMLKHVRVMNVCTVIMYMILCTQLVVTNQYITGIIRNLVLVYTGFYK